MLGTVVLEMPPEAPAAASRSVVERCEAVLGDGRCGLGDGLGSARYYGRIRVRPPAAPDAAVEIEVELRRGAHDGELLQTRSISFLARESPQDRWATVGVLVAAMVVFWDAQPAPPPPPPRLPAPAAPPEPAAVPEPRPLLLWVDGGATLTWLGSGALAPGVAVRASVGYRPLHLLVLGGARYASKATGEPSVRWSGLDAGFGTYVGPWAGRWSIQLHAEAEWQRLRVSAEDSSTGRREALGSHRFGLRLGLDTSVQLSGHLSALVGLEGSVMRPEVLVDVQDVTRERVEPVALGGFFGVRLHL